MKKDIRVIKRIISFILVLTLVCTSSVNSHAIVKGEDSLDINTNAERIMEMDDTRIDYYETSEGDRVFLQYVNGVLTQKNVLPYNRDNVVLREFYAINSTIIKTVY